MITKVISTRQRTVTMSPRARGPSAGRLLPSACGQPTLGSTLTRGRCARWSPAWIASSALLGLLATALVAGCGGSGVHAQTDPTPSPSITSPAVTPSSSPAAPTKAQQAEAAAIAQVRRYEYLLDTLAIRPRVSLDRLYSVSTQPDVTEEIAYLNQFRETRDRQIGRVQLSGTKADSVDLANHPHARHPVYPTVTVTTCVKVSGVRTLNAKGKSTVSRSRKPYFLTRLTLVNFKYPDPKQWLVRKVTDTEERSCGA